MEKYELPRIPARPRDAHKGDFGRVLVLAGSPRMTGAALLCARAALRGGAGLVTLAVPERIHPWLASRVDCEMTLPVAQTREGTFSYKAVDSVLEVLSGMKAFALGPGITTHRDTQDFVRFISRRAAVPGVLDADGLNNLSADLTEVREAPAARILTPHPGELARLESTTPARVQSDRSGAVQALAKRAGAVVVLKGWRTLVSDGERLHENRTGNPGMATAGSGDVLTGVVAGLLASGMEPFDAAALGVHVHGRAGDLAAARVGEISLTALDILDGLGPAFAELTESHG